MKKIIRIATVPASLDTFCRGLLRELSDEYEVVAVSSRGKELDDIAEREQVRTVAVDMERRIAPLKDLVSLIRLVAVFRRERPDMVHSMTPKAGLLGMMAARLAGVPIRIHTFTGLVFPTATGIRRLLLKTTDRLTCICATHVIPEGEGVKNDLAQNHITSKPMQVLGYGNVRGIDLKHYDRSDSTVSEAISIRRKLGIKDDDFVFVFVGRVVGDKGMKELSVAFARLAEKHTDVSLLIVGEEETVDAIDCETRKRLDSIAAIHKVGAKKDVRPWYAAANALVFPSYREGFPNVVIEACAMGLPCIVTDINGSREIIENGENGVIVPPHDADALYGAMRDFVEQRDTTTERMASQARSSVASRFEQGYVRQCLKDYYHKVL